MNLLSHSRARVERFLDVLNAVDAEARGRRLTPERRRVLEDALRDFAACVYVDARYRRRFEDVYEDAEEQRMRIVDLARQWLANGSLSIDQAAELHHRVGRLRMLYVFYMPSDLEEPVPTDAFALSRATMSDTRQESVAR